MYKKFLDTLKAVTPLEDVQFHFGFYGTTMEVKVKIAYIQEANCFDENHGFERAVKQVYNKALKKHTEAIRTRIESKRCDLNELKEKEEKVEKEINKLVEYVKYLDENISWEEES